MNRLAWLVVGGGLLVSGAVAGVVGGCSTDAPVTETDAGDPTSSSSGGSNSSSGTSGSSSGTSGTSGGTSSGSSGDPVDAGGGDGGATDGGGDGGGDGGRSNPNKITCGNTACDAGTSRCCWPENDAGAGVCAATCQGNNTFEVQCDEKADCANPNHKCCIGFGEAECSAQCFLGPQLCKTGAECGDAGPCNEKSCTRGNGANAVVLKLRVCGTPLGCQ